MVRCSFCEENMPHGTGVMFVKLDGKILHFCKSKCERNMLKLERRPDLIKWTRAAKRMQASKKKQEKKSNEKDDKGEGQ